MDVQGKLCHDTAMLLHVRPKATLLTLALVATTLSLPARAVSTEVVPAYTGLGVAAVHNGIVYAFQRQGQAHVGVSGRIAMLARAPSSELWASKTIFDSEWDDRNAAGGITPKGRFVVFLARYNPSDETFLDMGYITSSDQGFSWSSYRRIPTGRDRLYSPYGSLVVLPSGRLMQLVYGSDIRTGRVRALFSEDDGLTWGKESLVMTTTERVQVSEATAVVVEGATDSTTKIVVVARSGSWRWVRKFAGGLVQFASLNGGRTWKSMGRISPSYSQNDVSPSLIAIGKGRLVLVWADRWTMQLKMSIATAGSVLRSAADWGPAVVVATSRSVERRKVVPRNFGYPSIVLTPPLNTPTAIYYDVAVFDFQQNDAEMAEAYTELVSLNLPINEGIARVR